MTDLALADAPTIEAVPDRPQTLDIVSARVADVENQLARLDQLIKEQVEHENKLAELAEEKLEILENQNLDKAARISKVGKILSAIEVETFDLAKTKSEVTGQKEYIKEIGITARGFIGHVFDGLRASRLTRARAFIDEFFYQRPMGIPAENLAGMSNLVREIDLLSHGLHPQPTIVAELVALRGLTEQWSVLRGLAEAEQGFAPELPESWL